MEHCFTRWPLAIPGSSRAQAVADRGMPRASVVLPFAGEDRLTACRAVVSGFLRQTVTDIEVIVAEQSDGRIWESAADNRTKYVYVDAGGREFNKCRAINAGVATAEAPVVLIHDADIVPPAAYIEEILKVLSQGWEAVRPLRFLFKLSQPDAEAFVRSDGDFRPTGITEVLQNFPGGSTAIRKQSYWEIGGHDEEFEGWGGEDVEFLGRVQTLKLFPGQYLPAVHLWHAPAEKKINGNWNRELLNRALSQLPHDRIERLRSVDLGQFT
jgi:glycosyltransferase involved in cell wall biosynthesis